MSVGINTGLYRQSNIFTQKNPQTNYAQNKAGFEKESISSGLMRKMQSQERTLSQNNKSVLEQSLSYASQLQASRAKAKETSLEKKKLQYSFKKISSQIVRSKNSVSARKAVQAAKREIMRLKRLKANGEYDEEEVQLAIDHAKAMEKVAKKKVAHLEQEEMVERAHKGAGAALEEVQENKDDSNEKSEEAKDAVSKEDFKASEMDIDEEYDETDYQAVYDSIRQEVEEAQMQMDELSAEISENTQEIAESSNDAMSQMMNELSEEMSEMLEEMGLTDLAETMYAPDPNMSEDDLKMLKIKHRGKEMKEIAEADKEYLKGIMEHEKSKQMGGDGMSGAGPAAPSASFGTGDAPRITPVISMPSAAAGATTIAPTISGGFDVSV
ncbi:MAG: hypothetical protein K6F75_00340 [Butyrivibrio sp.]|nr:hypothetical protein [Butyrivibrio sp.]